MTEEEFRSQDTTGVKSFDEKLTEVLLVACSPGNAHVDHYSRGMANGLILADAIRNDTEPQYITPEAVFDYATEAEKTCSVMFKPEQVDYVDFVLLLERIIADGEKLNLRKKLLFRGKSPKDVGLKEPREGESLFDVFGGADDATINIIHGIVGILTEAAEMAEILHKRVVSGGEFDRVHVLEETGDVAWYQERLLKGIGVHRKLMQHSNIDKLRGRHGAAFDVFRDANRNLSVEREKLEAAVPLFDNTEKVAATNAAAARMSDDRPCLGDNIHQPPGPGFVWDAGCWRSDKRPAADIPGMDC